MRKTLKLKVPRGEHHKPNHRAPQNHHEFHVLGNPSGRPQGNAGTSQETAGMQGAQGVEQE